MADAITALRTIRREPLAADVPGTQRALTVLRYGAAGARPKAYLQAALHADEVPGMLVLHHLIGRLDAAATAGAIAGEIVLVPAANPIGLSQWLDGTLQGRFDGASRSNFNRQFPVIAAAVAERVAGRLGTDATANAAAVRQAIATELMARRPDTEVAALRLTLMRYAADADIVLDLHCDHEGLPHLYVNAAQSPLTAELADRLGCPVILLAEDSGGEPFDEACAAPWHKLRADGAAIPLGCFSATLELRGMADVDDVLADGDAAALYDFLTAVGVLSGQAPARPRAVGHVSGLNAVDVIKSPAGGVLVFRKALGSRVMAGDVVAEIIDPFVADPAAARTPVATRTDGILFARGLPRFARVGQVIAKVAGTQPLPGREGNLLVD